MMEIAQPIDLKLPEKLQDKAYRQRFFLAEASARIAEQLIKLRKRRGLSQKEVADLVDTKQPAISRAEQADYQNWSFSTLRGIAAALDARIRVVIEPSEDVLAEYDEPVIVVVSGSLLSNNDAVKIQASATQAPTTTSVRAPTYQSVELQVSA